MNERQRKRNQESRIRFNQQLQNTQFDENYFIEKFTEESFYIAYQQYDTRTKFRYYPGSQKLHRLYDNTWTELSQENFLHLISDKDLFK
jgi:hypothetical protein